MGALQTVAWICFVVSVLIWPPSSVAHLDESLGWVFSVPTIAFCFLLADAVMDVTSGGLRTWLSLLRGLFVLVGVLPVVLYGAGWEWLEVPAAVLAVVANVALVLALWQAGGDTGADDGRADRSAGGAQPTDGQRGTGPQAAAEARAERRLSRRYDEAAPGGPGAAAWSC